MKLRFILSVATFALLSAPVIAQDANVEGRVGKLEKEMRAVQRKVFPDGAGKFLEAEIAAEGTKPPTTGAPSASAVTDLIERVDALETQLATLTGQVEQQGASMRSMETRLKALEGQVKGLATAQTTPVIAAPAEKTTAPAPKRAVTATKPAAASAKPSAARTAAVSAIARPSSGDAFEDSYGYGYRLWEAKYYPEAQVQLEETVAKFPKHKRASYARNLLGRAWLDDSKPATAVKIFYDNYKNDPRGDRAPESLYFLGSALTDLNKATEACEAYGQLASAYPAEAGGRLAERLAEGRKRAKCK